ncbi:MAG: dockerin type I domain-containing protein, partial [Acutalibacteraceae bacterium]
IDSSKYGAYSLIAVASDGTNSEFSRPIVVSPASQKIEAENCTYTGGSKVSSPSGYSGTGLVRSTATNNCVVTINYNAENDGTYLLSAMFNNKGDAQSGVSCGIRSVYVDGKDAGTLVFPETYNYYQTSTHLALNLSKGSHEIKVLYDTENWYDRNMSITKSNVDYDYFTIEQSMDMFADYELGDANKDGSLDVKDATFIQKYVAKIISTIDKEYADVNKDDIVNVKDATLIQKKIAKIIDSF